MLPLLMPVTAAVFAVTINYSRAARRRPSGLS
jgi:hypothetical protein